MKYLGINGVLLTTVKLKMSVLIVYNSLLQSFEFPILVRYCFEEDLIIFPFSIDAFLINPKFIQSKWCLSTMIR